MRLGGAQQRDLEAVELRLGRAQGGVRVGAVGSRVQVGSARQAQTPEPIQQRLDAGGVHRRDDDRHGARTAHRIGIAQSERELAFGGLAAWVVADALGGAHLGRAESDDGVRNACIGHGQVLGASGHRMRG